MSLGAPGDSPAGPRRRRPPLLRRRHEALLGVLAMLVLGVTSAEASNRRPRFEPTDLSLESAGQFSADLEVGLTVDPSGLTLLAPDFELNLGLSEDAELDIDGALTLKNWTAGAPTAVPDNLWVSLKWGLWGDDDDADENDVGVGLQFGPRLALVPGFTGLGVEGLLLTSYRWKQWTFVLNTGGYLEPSPLQSHAAEAGFTAGLDVTHPLSERFTLEAEAFGVVTNGMAPHQAGASVGLAWQAVPAVAFSTRVVGGLLGGGPGISVLLGVSPSLKAW